MCNFKAATTVLIMVMMAGCSGVNFRVRDTLPDLSRTNAEWRGVVVSPVKEYRAYGRHCFTTKRGETSPGAALACSGNPNVVREMYEIPFKSEPGSAPTVVRFDYVPMGGDQLEAIGPSIKARLVDRLRQASRSKEAKHLGSCRQLVAALDGMLGKQAVMIKSQKPFDHHDMIEGVVLGRDAVAAFFDEYGWDVDNPQRPDEVASHEGCGSIAAELLEAVEAAPLTGYLEITGAVSWNR